MDTLKEIRRQKGLSQKDLADESGVGQDTISGIESGRHEPRPSTLRKLAAALDVEVADFFREPVRPLAEAPEPGQPKERSPVNISAASGGASGVSVDVEELRRVMTLVARQEISVDDAMRRLRAA